MEHDPKNPHPDDDASSSSQQISESKMRQALGIEARSSDRPLTPPSHGTTAQRRRFVADGDVPVVLIGRRRDHGGQGAGERTEHNSGLTDRVNALEAALATERETHHRADALLVEARHTIQHLQTLVAHAELARDEAAAHARRAEADRAAAIKDMQAAARTLPPVEPQPAPTAALPPPMVQPQPPEQHASRFEPAAVPTGPRSRRALLPAVDAVGSDVPAYTASIMAAYLMRHQLSPAELPGLAEQLTHALMTASSTPEPALAPDSALKTRRPRLRDPILLD